MKNFIRKSFFATLIGFSLIPFSSGANAEAIQGTVKFLEPTYLPGYIGFFMDSSSPSCPIGKSLIWKKDAENNKIVYNTLFAAMLSGAKVTAFLNDGDSSCQVHYLHIRPN